MNIKLIDETIRGRMANLMSDYENGGLSLQDFYDRSQDVLRAVQSAESQCIKREDLDTLWELQMHVLICRGKAASHLFVKEGSQHEGTESQSFSKARL